MVNQYGIIRCFAYRILRSHHYDGFITRFIKDIAIFFMILVVELKIAQIFQNIGRKEKRVGENDGLHAADRGSQNTFINFKLSGNMLFCQQCVHTPVILFSQEIGHILHDKIGNFSNLLFIYFVKNIFDKMCSIVGIELCDQAIDCICK